jgi:hypothetical protein
MITCVLAVDKLRDLCLEGTMTDPLLWYEAVSTELCTTVPTEITSDRWILSGTELGTVWSSTPTPPCAFMSCTDNFTLPYRNWNNIFESWFEFLETCSGAVEYKEAT